MAPRRVRPCGGVSDFADVVSKVAGDYVKDRCLCFSLALGATSLALFTAHQTSRPDIAAQFRAASAERADIRHACLEATMINQNFSQQILKSSKTRKSFNLPNPFFDVEDDDGMEPASVAYRYRRFDLGDEAHLQGAVIHLDGVLGA